MEALEIEGRAEPRLCGLAQLLPAQVADLVAQRLRRQVGIGGDDGGDGVCVLRDAERGAGGAAVAGDERVVVVQRRDRDRDRLGVGEGAVADPHRHVVDVVGTGIARRLASLVYESLLAFTIVFFAGLVFYGAASERLSGSGTRPIFEESSSALWREWAAGSMNRLPWWMPGWPTAPVSTP